eukprot:CAMPEP_0194051650 /NCGR_PEP_ID=MMETSP0009_2-20130614/41600_1 /TAXON_ID=210454 /ORGANISM="Grammatophora oceanica, Strain CCMP 410" /LENGTH=78 /DNA_ID=CAMNT_0038698845 /DNA_START=18 /DNA_END=251 /DNA_ORIENTATION=+
MQTSSELMDEDGSAGMLRATVSLAKASAPFEESSKNLEKLFYVGNDAVHTLGVQSFHEPLQEEINRRMELNGSSSDQD